MDTEEIGKKLKTMFTKGAAASKEAFEKAGDKVQNFTDKSVVKIEKKQLENKQEAKYAELGKLTYSAMDKSANPTFETEEHKNKLKVLQKEIKELAEQIKEKEELLK